MNSKKLHRYTSFSSLAHMLINKKFTLLDPQGWDDRNDAYFMEAYRKSIDAEKIYALCFSEAEQKYHHWSVFAAGADGVCISFYKEDLVKAVSNAGDFEFRKVKYAGAKEAARVVSSDASQLKFTKHRRYSDEREWRLLYTGIDGHRRIPTVPIDLGIIERITISPWLAKPLVTSLTNLIKGIPDCSKLSVKRSTLVVYQDWRSIADSAFGSAAK